MGSLQPFKNEDAPWSVLRLLKTEDSPGESLQLLKPLRTFHGRSSTFARAMRTRHSPSGVCSPRVPAITIEPQSGTSPLRRRQSTTPSGSPPARGRGSPRQKFGEPFASSCGEAGALAKFSASPFCEINKKLVWRLGVDGIHWLSGLRGVGPTPLQATFRNTSP